MHRKRPILIALAFFVLAGTLLAYPWVSSLLSEKYHSDVETAYCTAMDSTSKQDLEKLPCAPCVAVPHKQLEHIITCDVVILVRP